MPRRELEWFGSAVRAVRGRQGISQEKLAELSELDRTYISGIERGVRNVGILNVYRVAAALGVKPSELFRTAEQLAAKSGGERGRTPRS